MQTAKARLADVLTREHIDTVRRTIARRVHPALVDDATQTVFAEAADAWDSFDPRRGTFAGWLWGITRHVAADTWRQQAGVARTEAAARAEAEIAATRPPHPDEEGTLMHLSEEWRDAIRALGPRDRALIIARGVEGWPADAVGDRLGMTVTAVNTAYNRACGRLRARLRLADPV